MGHRDGALALGLSGLMSWLPWLNRMEHHCLCLHQNLKLPAPSLVPSPWAIGVGGRYWHMALSSTSDLPPSLYLYILLIFQLRRSLQQPQQWTPLESSISSTWHSTPVCHAAGGMPQGEPKCPKNSESGPPAWGFFVFSIGTKQLLKHGVFKRKSCLHFHP